MTDAIGNLRWLRRYNFGVNERPNEVATDDSHLYTLTFASNVYHSHIAKIAPDGNTVWSYRYLGENPENSFKND